MSNFFSPLRRRRVGSDDARLRRLVLRVDRFESRLPELRTIDVPPSASADTLLSITAALAGERLPHLVQSIHVPRP